MFYQDFAGLVSQSTAKESMQRDYILPDIPNSEAYPVDYRLKGKSSEQSFVCGVRNRDRACLAKVVLSQFHGFRLDCEPIRLFTNQAELPRMDLARPSDVYGKTVSSLGSREDLRRKMKRRIAPT